MLGSWVTGVFFFKFWRRSRDRIFLFFGIAFWILALERLVLVLAGDPNSLRHVPIFLLRLLGFGVILFAIVDRNKR